jgi:hypothetical protein
MRGTSFIAVGLVVLLLAPAWPTAPVVTAVSLIALGATHITLARLRNNPHVLPLVFLHAAIYTVLYALFLCATLHASSVAAASNIQLHVGLDIALSVLPMAVAAQRISKRLLQPASQSR